jgi:hypothetical protein
MTQMRICKVNNFQQCNISQGAVIENIHKYELVINILIDYTVIYGIRQMWE